MPIVKPKGFEVASSLSQRAAQNVKIVPVELTLPPAHQKQYEFINKLRANKNDTSKPRFIVGACGSKFGKELSIETIIPTPAGYRKLKDIEKGNFVFDENGKPVLVCGLSEISKGNRTFAVTFSDGSVIHCSGDHWWVTETNACRKANADLTGKNKVKRRRKSTSQVPAKRTTLELLDTLYIGAGRNKKKPNHSIPILSAPLQMPARNLPIDPYILGVWLGDGHQHAPKITTVDTDILDEFKALGFPLELKGYDVTIGQTWTCTNDELKKKLKDLDLINNKHVPKRYLIASAEQRLALLQGLMDTDGTVSKEGHCCFDNTNLNLANAVALLAQSLGIKVMRNGRFGKLNGVENKFCYRVNFTTSLPVFRIKRKLARLRPVAIKTQRRYIVDIKEVQSEPMMCLEVASPTNQYLCGEACIPTHNTFGCVIRLIQEAWNNKGSLNWWVAPTYSQAKMAYYTTKRMLPRGSYVEYKADLRLVIMEPDGRERSIIEYKSADNDDGLRGFAVDFFVIDEASRIKYESFVSVTTTVTQTGGRGIIISTPKGRGWFWDVYMRGVKEINGAKRFGKDHPDPFPEWFSIRMPTWENPHVPIESLRQAKKSLPDDVFRQEFGAMFIEDSAGVFRNVSKCVIGHQLEEPMPGTRYVLGVDLARLRDYTVVIVLDTHRKHVVYMERFNKISWELQYSRILQVAATYNNATVSIDWTGIGDPIVENLQQMGLRMEPYKIGGSTAKQQLVEKLRVNIENGTISIPEVPVTRVLLEELRNYEYTFTKSGQIVYSAPSGKHDDCVMALALANWIGDTVPSVYKAWNQPGI